jgi:hypothetical protein
MSLAYTGLLGHRVGQLADEPVDVPGRVLQPDGRMSMACACVWPGLAGLLDGWVLGESFGPER